MNKKAFPLDKTKIDGIIAEQRVDIQNASIRQVNLIVLEVQKKLGTRFIRMEFGVPGLTADKTGCDYERDLIKNKKVNSDYPPFNGTEEFRKAASKFFKMFANADVPPETTVATCGAQQGCFLSQAMLGRIDSQKDTILFIDPGFSVNKLQVKFLGLKSQSIDIYEREKFLDKLENTLSKGNISAALWSSPNNPVWTVFSEDELKEMGRLFTKHEVVGIEDDAYFGMDFRTDYSAPGVEPFIPTIAKYTDNYICLLSSSKIFNYAGQRVGCALISPKLAFTEYPNLTKNYAAKMFLDAFVQGGVYPTTSGVTHSAQLAVAYMMNEASEGRFNFIEPLRVYGKRAKYFKKTMIENGFKLVYDRDGDRPLADGFYFSASYPGLSGTELLKELLYYGISVTTLNTFGSTRTEGVRICVSLEDEKSYEMFRERIEAFRENH